MASDQTPYDVVVVGAGIAGLACARALAPKYRVRVIEASGNVGGRLGDEHEQGTQFFTAREPAMLDAVGDWLDQGCVAEWVAREHRPSGMTRPFRAWVGLPDMAAPARHWAAGLDCTLHTPLTALTATADGWLLTTEHGPLHSRAVVLAMPAPLAAPWCRGAAFAPLLRGIRYLPCCSVTLTLAEPLALDWDVWRDGGAPLAWAARLNSKPGRPASPETWVLHADRAWSADHADAAADWQVQQLLAAFAERCGRAITPSQCHSRFWPQAEAVGLANCRCLLDPECLLGVCGDGYLGPRLEDAASSGWALATALDGVLTHGVNNGYDRSDFAEEYSRDPWSTGSGAL